MYEVHGQWIEEDYQEPEEVRPTLRDAFGLEVVNALKEIGEYCRRATSCDKCCWYSEDEKECIFNEMPEGWHLKGQDEWS